MSHMFADWSRVADGDGRGGVVVWDPTTSEYRVLWDDNGWDSYAADEAKHALVAA
jgi:hypothetical protein